MAKIVSAQCERRDNIIWSYSLRGESPPNNEYREGLKELILSYNNFSDILASEIVLALRNDVYMRSIDLRSNDISETWVKEFIMLFDTNFSLTNVDLRENYGFNTKTHRELAMKLLRNIHQLNSLGELETDENDINCNCSS